MAELLRFEWDAQKAARNRAKHRVSFQEPVTVFGDPLGRITDDPRPTADEERFALLGESHRGRLLVVMFVERGEAIRAGNQRTEGDAP